MLGKSKFRKAPQFFYDYFGSKIIEFDSPNFIRNRKNKSLKILKSFGYNLLRAGRYFKSIRNINKAVISYKPDLIINFYEPLTGLYRLLYKKQVPCISVAHQFGWKQTGYISSGSFTQRTTEKLLTNISGYGSDKLFCISPTEKSSNETGLVFIPPLIRKEIKNAISGNNNSITAYLLNAGYADEVINDHKKHPEQEVNCFIDEVPKHDYENKKLSFHLIDDKTFIEHLSSSSSFISTAGFESICEAMYLGKPVMMIPVGNHFEQHLNAIYFEKIGAGLKSDFFDLDKFLNFTLTFNPVNGFKEWVNKGSDIIINAINDLMNK
jgi:uncharacterized protein (TIGR00661 family)